MNNALRSVKEFMGITLDGIADSQYEKEGMTTATVRQMVKTIAYYQGAKIANSLSDTIFSKEDFGETTEEKPYESITPRVAFIKVPTGTTPEQFMTQLATILKEKGVDKVKIYRILSSRPILTDEQKAAIRSGRTTMEIIAAKQAVRYPEGAKDEQGNDIGGNLIPDTNGKIQYRGTFFTHSGVEDSDLRSEDPNDTYFSDELAEEFATVTTGEMPSVPFVAEEPSMQTA